MAKNINNIGKKINVTFEYMGVTYEREVSVSCWIDDLHSHLCFLIQQTGYENKHLIKNVKIADLEKDGD